MRVLSLLICLVEVHCQLPFNLPNPFALLPNPLSTNEASTTTTASPLNLGGFGGLPDYQQFIMSIGQNISNGISGGTNNTIKKFEGLFAGSPLEGFVTQGGDTLENIVSKIANGANPAILQKALNEAVLTFAPLAARVALQGILNPFQTMLLKNSQEIQNSSNPLNSFLGTLMSPEAQKLLPVNFSLPEALTIDDILGSKGPKRDATDLSIPEPAKAMIDTALGDFNRARNANIMDGIAQLLTAFTNFQQGASALLGGITTIGQTAIKEIQDRINGLTETVRNCVKKNELPFGTVIPIAAATATKCVSDKVSEGTAIIIHGVENVQQAYQGFKELQEKLKNCIREALDGTVRTNFNFGLFGCFASSVLNIQSETILLPIEIARRVLEAQMIVDSLRAYAVQCMANLTQAIGFQAFNATKTIAGCLFQAKGGGPGS